jgi:putative transposase
MQGEAAHAVATVCFTTVCFTIRSARKPIDFSRGMNSVADRRDVGARQVSFVFMKKCSLDIFPQMQYICSMKTYKYRIYPTKAQETILNKMLEECRWVYNKTLETRKNSYEQQGVSLGLYDTQKLLPEWKQQRSSLKLVHSQVLQNVCVRVDLAFKGFFRRVKAHPEGSREPGYPRFKGYGRYDSFCYPQYGNGARLEGSTLILSKLGNVKVKWHRALCGTPKTVCLRRSRTGKWFVTFSCELALAGCEPGTLGGCLPDESKRVGVDVGLAHFFTTSNGDKVDNPRFFRLEEKELAKAQRRMSKFDKNTPERKKRCLVVSRIHERITNKRTDFAHQQARCLVNTYGVIVFEDLTITNMVQNGSLAKSIADVAWSQFAQFTAYKAADAGRLFLQVDPRNTSKKCSRCASLVDKDLSVRVHSCPHCGLILDRDQNAAINILALGLQRMGSQSLEAHRL